MDESTRIAIFRLEDEIYRLRRQIESLTLGYEERGGTRRQLAAGVAEARWQSKQPKKKARKLTKWQKFVKEKSKLPRFKYKTGKRKGMVNMKAVAAAWKKVPKSKK
jgi:hypothetical protein